MGTRLPTHAGFGAHLAGLFFLTGAVTSVFGTTGGLHAALLICGLVRLVGVPIALILVRPTGTDRR